MVVCWDYYKYFCLNSSTIPNVSHSTFCSLRKLLLVFQEWGECRRSAGSTTLSTAGRRLTNSLQERSGDVLLKRLPIVEVDLQFECNSLQLLLYEIMPKREHVTGLPYYIQCRSNSQSTRHEKSLYNSQHVGVSKRCINKGRKMCLISMAFKFSNMFSNKEHIEFQFL